MVRRVCETPSSAGGETESALPPGNPQMFRMTLDLAERFRPIDEAGLERPRQHEGRAEPLFVK